MSQFLTVEFLGHAAIVTLSQPPANQFTVEALEALADQLDELSAHDEVHALVLTGAGERFFSGGLALSVLADGSREQAARLVDALQRALAALRAYPGVSVAAINGYALGAGLEAALCCDYVVAERGARLGMPQARFGLVPAGGGAKLLADKIGAAWSKRLILGGELIDADTAWRIGLVEEAADPGLSKIVAISLADRVAQQGPCAVSAAHRLIEDSAGVDLVSHLAAARSAFVQLAGTPEQQAGIRAFLEKRQPPWSDDEAWDDAYDF